MHNSQESPAAKFPEVVISPKGADRARSGHLWIYRSDVLRRPSAESGAVVRVTDKRGRFMALAHYGAESEISLRLLTFQDIALTRDFWRDRLHRAIAWRERIVSNTETYRLVHGEGDLLPGLIVDRYGDCLTMQTLTRGMELLKPLWIELLAEKFAPRLIVERNDVKVRQLEGLPLFSRVVYEAGKGRLSGDAFVTETEEFIVSENGIRFYVDLIGGQKTGAFLDQRENRAAVMQYACGRGMDCFSFHGSFALHLATKCDSVLALDISALAIERARRNAALNDITNIEFIQANVFDRLRDQADAGEQFETIVLDPPAFAKNRGAVEAALRGYKEINLRALKMLRPGGVLMTCSCSYHVTEPLFLEMLMEAARDAGREVQILEKRTQSRDHPILLTVPETYYLKCVVARVL
jgi:23S rRNA (cytosine1962-C5)-methyltransferase